MGRTPEGDVAMSAAERQRRRRARVREQGLKPIWVKGSNGAFDPRLRLALAIKTMIAEGEAEPDLVRRLVTLGGRSVSAVRRAPERLYMEREIRRFLEVDVDGRPLEPAAPREDEE